MTARRRTPLLLPPILMTATLALTGCSTLSDVAGSVQKKNHEESFATTAAAEKGWVGVQAPQWLPADSTDIHNKATNNEIDSVIVVKSAAALPSWCVQAERKHLPFTSTDWAPAQPTFPDEVHDCGDYEVMRTSDGYLGWFTGSAEGQRPAPGPVS